MNVNLGVNKAEIITALPATVITVIDKLEEHIPDTNEVVSNMKTESASYLSVLDKLLTELLWWQLKKSDVLKASGLIRSEYHRPQQLPAFYERWLDETLRVLVSAGYLEKEGNKFTPTGKGGASKDAWSAWETAKVTDLSDVNVKAQVALLDATMKALPDILSGKVPATDVLFPEGSMKLVEGIYKHNKVADYFNEVLSETLTAYCQERIRQDKNARINILEIGAGTGGTSAILFKQLAPFREHIESYCYTDLSRAFLMYAENTYAPSVPYLQCRIFDVEKPAIPQGIEQGKYDIVIAANVLHATRNIRRTLRNAKAAMKNRGLLMLNEMSHNTLFTHLTFGLLEGWWLYEDAPVRMAGCPGLSPESWKNVFTAEGYDKVFFPSAYGIALGQQIVVAESNGIIRQPRPSSVTTNSDSSSPAPRLPAGKAVADTTSVPNGDGDGLKGKTVAYLQQIIGETLRIPAGNIKPTVALEDYGIDSIIVVQLNKALGEVFADLSNTLFFEYQTVNELAAYFIKAYPDQLKAKLQLDAEQDETPVLSEKVTKPVIAKKGPVFKGVKKKETVAAVKETTDLPVREPIAIIGISGRYPGGDNLAAFWESLKNGKDSISEIPADRWSLDDFYVPDKTAALENGKSYSKWGGFINGHADFDPQFFNISPREAVNIDPQERLFLQACWEVMEDAGYTRRQIAEQFAHRVGVFAGITRTGFDLYGPELWRKGAAYFPRTSFSSLANRTSYLLNLRGPSMPVDTMCSSSLTAIHEACEHLYRNECEMAIAGGVNLYLHPSSYVLFCSQQMLAADGKCKSFGEGGDGFVPGEGVGVVLLKKLSLAERDNDHIYAVIKASGVNHGGKTNGYTVPNPVAQAALISETITKAGIEAEAISYIEAHGTGTELGDPIEITGLSQGFASTENQFCSIGAVKSNIGHCEAAAGIAGITKVVLQMKHGLIAPTLHAETLNPKIRFESTPFVVKRELTEWKRPVREKHGLMQEVPRIAGISSFGAGGSNAHVLVQEYISPAREQVVYDQLLIVLSARTTAQLQEKVRDLLQFIDSEGQSAELADIAYTLQTGREEMEQRAAFVCSSADTLRQTLAGYLQSDGQAAGIYRGQVKKGQSSTVTFTNDEDFRDTLTTWISKGKLDKLAELWTGGLEIDWSLLYEEGMPRRISLPVYPFARERYWFPELDKQDNGQIADKPSIIKSAVKTDTHELLTFEELWVPAGLSTQILPTAGVLICCVDNAASIAAISTSVVSLLPAAKLLFVSNDSIAGQEHVYQLGKDKAAGYKTVFHKIKETYGAVDGILYTGAGNEAAYEDILYLLQGILSSGLKTSRLLLEGRYSSALEQCYTFSWIGYARSLGFVLPGMDIHVVLHAAAHSLNMQTLLGELWYNGSHVAHYENNVRTIPQLEERTTETSAVPLLKQGGTYIVTGGFGGLGLLFSSYLSKTWKANVIMTGRRRLSTEEEAKVAAIQGNQNKVVYVQADVSDAAAMQNVRTTAKQITGEISGILHIAGVQSHTTIGDKQYEDFKTVLSSKIRGSQVLDEVFGQEALDFVCYFSSSSAVLGDFGSCDYAIANRFQMSYGALRRAAGFNGVTTVINWPLWREGGMSLGESSSLDLYLRSSGQSYLEAAMGLSTFESLLRAGNVTRLVMYGDRSRIYQMPLLSGETELPVSTIVSENGVGRSAEMHGWSVDECLLWDLRRQVGELLQLGMEKVAADVNLADFGFDSVSLMQLSKRLSAYYDIEVTPAVFFSYATIEKLREYYLGEHADKINAFYSEAQTVVVPGKRSIPVRPVSHTAATARQTPVSGNTTDEPIAVIGMSGRFPQAATIAEMWKLVAAGKSAIEEIPATRWDWREYHDEQVMPGKSNSKWGGFIPDVDQFDPLFFEIAPLEATYMDPRQRLLLQEAWAALEDAGYGPAQINSNKIGMFVGSEDGEYQILTGGQGSITSNHAAIMSARLSYFLNLDGPNINVNTACSSGLVALHLACQSLRSNECDTALAAGVNLLLTPMSYVQMSQAGILSPDGKCFTFDKRANGMVPGEAVAVVVLKKLSAAIADGDPVYAVIDGSGVNYDGKTNGITAPNGNSQRALLQDVYSRYHIDPAAIDYVVAHGTGTKLGDPIEVNALAQAFRGYTDKQGYCAISSVKTNFGHTFAASGLVSLISLVKAVQEKVIPANLHFEEQNEFIHWNGSPFYVPRQAAAWPEVNGKARTGAVSSFGMSGTNAHVVVSSYSGVNVPAAVSTAPVLLLLSAKTEEALLRKMEDMIAYLQSGSENLSQVAYTLQEGRHHFIYRAAIVVQHQQDAIQTWTRALNKEQLPQLFSNKVSRDFKAQAALMSYGTELLRKCADNQLPAQQFRESLYALAELYCQGYDFPWRELYSDVPQRLHLPVYPFEKEHYWVAEKQTGSGNTGVSHIGGLLHTNTSTLDGLTFSSSFKGNEFFLADHVVKGKKILPGVAHIEMAYAALKQVAAEYAASGTSVVLKNITWMRPAIQEKEPLQMKISLTANEDGQIDYQIQSMTADGREKILNSTGTAYIVQETVPSSYDLAQLRKELGNAIDGEMVYNTFKGIGLDYGASFRGINELYTDGVQVLARLSLPENLFSAAYNLHPGMMDAALQSFIGFVFGSIADPKELDIRSLKPALPFALDSISIFGACQPEMWALTRFSEGYSAAGSIQKLDIDICDNAGNVLISLSGFTTRTLTEDAGTDHKQDTGTPVGKLLLRPVWKTNRQQQATLYPALDAKVLVVHNGAEPKAVLDDYPDALFLAISGQESVAVLEEKLAAIGKIDHIIWQSASSTSYTVDADALISAQEGIVYALFRFVKALLKAGYGAEKLGWTIVTKQSLAVADDEEVNAAHAAIHGLAGVMAKEYPNWKVRLADIDKDNELPQSLFRMPADPHGNALVYRGGQWKQQELIVYEQQQNETTSYRQEGVYVVIGGAGGIGEVWTDYMISKYKAQVIWIGRRAYDQTIAARISKLSIKGPAPVYYAADAASYASLHAVYEQIKQRFGTINGIIHSAIVLQDQGLGNMTEEKFRAGLSAKLDVSVRLAQVFAAEQLDFVLFFSSMTTFTKAPGQSNYAAGCTFKDAFALQLAQTWDCPVKVINWGYWGSVGIVADDTYRERMALAGFDSIEPVDGMAALETLLASPVAQLAFIKTCKPLQMEGIKLSERMTVYPASIQVNATHTPNDVTGTLKEIVAAATGIMAENIDMQTTFGEYCADPEVFAAIAAGISEQLDIHLNAGLLMSFTDLAELCKYVQSLTGVNTIDYSSPERLEQIWQKVGALALEMEQLLARLLFVHLRDLGCFTSPGTCTVLMENGRIVPAYKRWMEESLAALVRAGLLTTQTGQYTVAQGAAQLPAEAVHQEWAAKRLLWLENPNLKNQVVLADATMGALQQIITGQVPATAIMFPGSSMEMVQGVYKDNLVADYFNELMAVALVNYLEQRKSTDPNLRLRILEIGAGTGGTSAMIFGKLKPYQQHIAEYCYTDISRAFLLHAEKAYLPDNPYIKTRIFDVEKPIQPQDIEAGVYDVVVATNVLHATSNISNTLRNAKAVLQTGGLLLLNELAASSLFTHLSFGLLDGWWLYEDPEVRLSGSPVLVADSWRKQLAYEGFKALQFPVKAAHHLGQQIIIAVSDGIVRQLVNKPAVAAPAAAPAKPPVKKATPVQQSVASNKRADKKAGLEEKALAYFKDLVGGVLKIPAHKIDVNASFESYGIDSILVVQLNNALKEVFGEVSSTLFFEYQDIRSLSAYFIDTQREALTSLLGDDIPSGIHSPREVSPVNDAPIAIPVAFGRKAGTTPVPSANGFTEQVNTTMPIAIIGISGKYAQAASLDAFWENLQTGKNCITEIPEERWNWRTHFDEEKGKWGTTYSRWGGFIPDIDRFDPLFFNISPIEAERIDPQERQFLETSYNAIADAGYTPAKLAADRKVGVFAGIMNGNYITGPSYHSVANRVSYVMNFQGPSLAVDTACSSSLTAIHLAIDSIRGGSCHCAIAGGVNLIVDPVHYMRLSAAGMLSAGDQCKAFGDGADGFVDGEGVGAVVLKPLARAIADGDHIYGVIQGSAINAGGRTNGYTVPNPVAQAQVVADALDRAGIDARTVSYVEAHGTGTVLGDPIEVNGLTRAFAATTDDKQFCAIGSVKTNIGHCESAAGIASLTKVLLQMKHGKLAPSLHAAQPNPNINFANTPFKVQAQLSDWSSPRIAGISSFGAGGANAHLVVTEYIPEPIVETQQMPVMIVLSARTAERLQAQVSQLLDAISVDGFNEPLAAIAYTLQVGREALEERLALVAGSVEALKQQLQAYLQGNHTAIFRGQVKPNKDIVAVFSSDETLAQVADQWLLQHNDAKVLEWWVKGLQINWEILYTTDRPRRISLPGYPFAGERYWQAALPLSVKATAPLPARDDKDYYDLLDAVLSDELSVQHATNEIVKMLN
ncbi:SDR family NAD(P)-dependent oxidoreductase [Chitinophaga pinensis]|uniref:Erythronolide synthase, 6-methylsalicylic acid synthase n=1 Tax=Chitinophaga pinensis (strain ATCC 43595 / DSM 2588 / LMG 13176 / NBRC 15968 / NCIMB 11800 / UQM 2034) TaxID=485918 RepID=A0A979GXX0_CHIPD|nr:SDR family NAD(P)-dependent oxidoreductase [Chitinophaga pinensis]ACU62721.1 erythronolide synthase, 6-methylsalicylic acid synthase [Chitinophaga pinensis DSM 2588]